MNEFYSYKPNTYSYRDVNSYTLNIFRWSIPVMSYTQLSRELSRYILMGNILDESYTYNVFSVQGCHSLNHKHSWHRYVKWFIFLIRIITCLPYGTDHLTFRGLCFSPEPKTFFTFLHTKQYSHSFELEKLVLFLNCTKISCFKMFFFLQNWGKSNIAPPSINYCAIVHVLNYKNWQNMFLSNFTALHPSIATFFVDIIISIGHCWLLFVKSLITLFGAVSITLKKLNWKNNITFNFCSLLLRRRIHTITQYLTQRDSNVVHSALDQHTSLDFYSASSLKPQSEGRRVAPIGHIILIPIQSVFVLSNY